MFCVYFASFFVERFVFFIIFQFPGGLPPPGLSSALGLPPSAGVPPRLDLPPGVSMGQPNSGNNMNHEKVKTGATSKQSAVLIRGFNKTYLKFGDKSYLFFTF